VDQVGIDKINSLLSERVVVVTFKKKNGDLRVMSCTKNLDHVPPSQWPRGKATLSEETKKKSTRVYDVKAKSWRSFIFDNVIETA